MALPLIPERSCGTCTLCCTVQGISALKKAPGQACPHCLPEKGCGIYSQRPSECGTFYCAWRQWPALGAHWFPASSHLMVVLSLNDRRVLIKVDPQQPDAWQRSPFYNEIKSMSKDMMPAGFQIAVQVDEHLTFILPDRDIELGRITDDEEVVFIRNSTPSGLQFSVHKRSSRSPM